MSDSRYTEYLWGRSPQHDISDPLHYPVLAVFAIAASIAPTTWFFPNFYGYLVSGAVLCLVTGYGVLFTDLQIRVDSTFLVLFGGYWIGLVVHYLYFPNPSLLQYVFVTPIAVSATVAVLPRLVEKRPQTFTMGLTLLSVVVMGIGVLMLWQVYWTSVELPYWVGEEVMGLYAIRTSSVFANPNTYGFFMMVGSLAALYTVLVRGGLVWFAALGLCLLGLFMSEGDAAILGFGVGSILVLSGRNRVLSFVGLGASVAAVYAMIRVGHFSQVMETTLLIRVDQWVLSLERLALDPLWGTGFDAGPELRGSRGPHNSYIEVLLHTGVIAGMLYLGALAYAVASGIRKRWTQWTGFVVGTVASLLTYMAFESLLLGGLSTSSIVLGLVVGLMLLPDSNEDRRLGSTAENDAFAPTSAERAPDLDRPTGRAETDSSTTTGEHD